MITICFQIQSIANGRKICQVDDDCTIHDLFQHATDASNGCPVFTLKYGFPPKILQLNEENKSKKLQEVGIANQERIIVQSDSDPDGSKTVDDKDTASTRKKTKSDKSHDKDDNNSPGRRQPRRKAAEIATESFPETIRMMKQAEEKEAKRQKKNERITKKPMSESTKTSLATARHFRNLESESTARRLKDGAVISSPRRQLRSSSSAGAATAGSSSMEEALLNAVSGKTKGARLLREGWKQAVNSAYEQNQAVARLAAIQANTVKYNLIPKKTGTTAEDDSTTLHVTYPKGIQGRQDYEDSIPLLDFPLLQSVILSIFNTDPAPEALRPSNLALLSPRVLWSVQYHYNSRSVDNDQHEQINSDDLVVVALKWIQPDVDWSYLRRRITKLSAKAEENVRQKQEASKSNKPDWDAAVSAIVSVEEAMEKMYDRKDDTFPDITELDDIDIQWKTETPSESDIDELIECIQSSDIKYDNTKVVTEYANFLIDKCSIHNWRELANSESERIHEEFAQSKDSPELNTIESWIDYAQDKSINEIIYEICDKNDDAIELLQEAANSGTPKDLAGWVLLIPELHTELVNFTKSHNVSTQVPSQGDLERWCRRSHVAINQLEWLTWFATPIE